MKKETEDGGLTCTRFDDTALIWVSSKQTRTTLRILATMRWVAHPTVTGRDPPEYKQEQRATCTRFNGPAPDPDQVRSCRP